MGTTLAAKLRLPIRVNVMLGAGLAHYPGIQSLVQLGKLALQQVGLQLGGFEEDAKEF